MSRVFSALDQEELVLLQDFACSIRADSIVGENINQMINFLKELNTNRAKEKVPSSVANQLEANGCTIEALQKASLVEQCGLQSGDQVISTVYKDLHGSDVSSIHLDLPRTSDQVLDRVYNSGLCSNSPFQFLTLILHSFLLEEGFFPIVELLESSEFDNIPWLEIPDEQFVRDDWNCDPCTARLSYRHRTDAQHTLCKLMVSKISDTAVASLYCAAGRDSSSTYHIVNLTTDDYVAVNNGEKRDTRYRSYTLRRGEELHAVVQELVGTVFPQLTATSSGEKADSIPACTTYTTASKPSTTDKIGDQTSAQSVSVMTRLSAQGQATEQTRVHSAIDRYYYAFGRGGQRTAQDEVLSEVVSSEHSQWATAPGPREDCKNTVPTMTAAMAQPKPDFVDAYASEDKRDWAEGLWYLDAAGNPLAPVREAKDDL